MAYQYLFIVVAFTFLAFSSFCIGNEFEVLTSDKEMFRELSQTSQSSQAGQAEGTKWAVLVAGSSGYGNYRHQADICHAYHILKNGGLKDDNIIVFMYDDIAYNDENPRPGVIINNPKGKNVYPGVVKDYTGEAVNSKNFYAVLVGNQRALTGGSGKVLKSGPNDHVFIYYADHGAAGMLGMPNLTDGIYAHDFIKVFKKMHASKSYKRMVIYVEACESGSMFDGILPNNLNIYVTTAANPNESSYGTYCGDDVPVPKGYEGVCLGDVFSVSWMEDSDKCNPLKETLEEQYIAVKNRTVATKTRSSHVTQYGELSLTKDVLAVYFLDDSSEARLTNYSSSEPADDQPAPLAAVEQRDVDLVYLKEKVRRTPVGSNDRMNAMKELNAMISHRNHIDQSMAAIGKALFGEEKGPSMLAMVRPAGQALVDDWDCLKAMARTYEAQCGLLKTYGRKYMRAFANICNAGVGPHQMAQVSAQVCNSRKLD